MHLPAPVQALPWAAALQGQPAPARALRGCSSCKKYLQHLDMDTQYFPFSVHVI